MTNEKTKLDSLKEEDFDDLVKQVSEIYRGRIPREVKTALFVSVMDDPKKKAFRIERRIDAGLTRLANKLYYADRCFYNKLFVDSSLLSEDQMKNFVTSESIAIANAANRLQSRIRFCEKTHLNEIALRRLSKLQTSLKNLMCKET